MFVANYHIPFAHVIRRANRIRKWTDRMLRIRRTYFKLSIIMRREKSRTSFFLLFYDFFKVSLSNLQHCHNFEQGFHCLVVCVYCNVGTCILCVLQYLVTTALVINYYNYHVWANQPADMTSVRSEAIKIKTGKNSVGWSIRCLSIINWVAMGW